VGLSTRKVVTITVKKVEVRKKMTSTTQTGLPVWHLYLGDKWLPLPTAHAVQFESIFTGARQDNRVSIPLLGKTVIDRFAREDMQWGKYHVKRVGGGTYDEGFSIYYWDDYAWTPFDQGCTRFISDAIHFKHTKTCIYINGQGYDILFNACVQTSRVPPHRSRAIRMSDETIIGLDKLSPVVGAVVHEDEVPAEMICPITKVCMTQPVVAGDGMSYELAAIRRWLQKSTTSPVTGQPMSKVLIANHILKSLIQSEIDGQHADSGDDDDDADDDDDDDADVALARSDDDKNDEEPDEQPDVKRRKILEAVQRRNVSACD
jgi:hypothetical protein